MENHPDIILKPALVFAFIKTMPFLLAGIALLIPAWCFAPLFTIPAMLFACLGLYRYLFIRRSRYTITPNHISCSRGVFLMQSHCVKMYKIKAYVLLQPLWLQWLQLMDLTLRTTDAEHPIIWLRGIPRSDLVDIIASHVKMARQCEEIDGC